MDVMGNVRISIRFRVRHGLGRLGLALAFVS